MNKLDRLCLKFTDPIERWFTRLTMKARTDVLEPDPYLCEKCGRVAEGHTKRHEFTNRFSK